LFFFLALTVLTASMLSRRAGWLADDSMPHVNYL
jgi:hypothetical protein